MSGALISSPILYTFFSPAEGQSPSPSPSPAIFNRHDLRWRKAGGWVRAGRREDFGRPFRSPLPSPASTFAPVVKEEKEERAVAQECVAVWAAKEEKRRPNTKQKKEEAQWFEDVNNMRKGGRRKSVRFAKSSVK